MRQERPAMSRGLRRKSGTDATGVIALPLCPKPSMPSRRSIMGLPSGRAVLRPQQQRQDGLQVVLNCNPQAVAVLPGKLPCMAEQPEHEVVEVGDNLEFIHVHSAKAIPPKCFPARFARGKVTKTKEQRVS